MTQYDDTGAPVATRTTTVATTPHADGAAVRTHSRDHSRDHDGGDLDVAAARHVPTDRVRWATVLGGVFAALSTLALLGTLGAAVASSAYDAGDSARAFGIGTGIWGIVSALIAFFIGGFVASNAAALPGKATGVLNALLVWAVAIPLAAYLTFTLASTAVRAAGSVAGTAAQAAANVAGGAAAGAGAAASNPDVVDQAQQATGGASNVAADASQTAQNLQDRAASVSTADVEQGVERAAGVASGGAWGTLIGMVLSLLAAAVGGFVGARGDDDLRDYRDRRIGA